MSAKLDRIGADLEKARKKRAEWDARVKDLERRYREEENSEIHEMVHAANLTPDQLSELLRMFAADMAPKPDTINTMNEEDWSRIAGVCNVFWRVFYNGICLCR